MRDDRRSPDGPDFPGFQDISHPWQEKAECLKPNDGRKYLHENVGEAET